MIFIFTIFNLVHVGCISQQRIKRSNARTNLATEYLKEGNSTDAITTLEMAVELNRKNAKAHEKLALAYSSKGAYELADKSFRKSLKLEDSPETHNNYGLMLLYQGQYEEAIQHFEAAVRNLTYRNTALALNNLGYTYFLKGDLKSAEFYLRDAVHRAPNLCQARKNLGDVLKAATKYGESINQFQDLKGSCKEMSQVASLEIANNQIELEQFSLACMELQDLMVVVTDTKLAQSASDRLSIACQISTH
jgi:type IV pilus biogenesis/stability protein PilW